MKRLAILGSTGSIGTQALDVVRSFPDYFDVVALTAGRNLNLLAEQVTEFQPDFYYCEGTPDEKTGLFPACCSERAIEEIVTDKNVDVVLNAISGYAGLDPTLQAIKSGKDVALANKESLVVAGELLTTMAKQNNAKLLPVDSEPNAIWQCLEGEKKETCRLIITASGGAFRNRDPKTLADVTPEEALKHPTWNMGPKITIDSATLMNKAFEVIEAHWLFEIPWEDIEVVIHHQSMIHSMVEFVDGSVKAHISPPDMRLPIQHALFYPERRRNDALKRFDPVEIASLTFESLETDNYPCFELALEYGQRRGTWPAALSGADETAVEMFLNRRIRFVDIPTLIRETLEAHEPVLEPSVDQLVEAVSWAQSRIRALVGGKA